MARTKKSSAKVRNQPRHAAPAPPGGSPEMALLTGRLLLTGLVVAATSALLSLFVWTLLPVALGWSPSVILTGSMLPAVEPGDIVVVAKVEPKVLRVGHVIRFVDPSRPSRHLLHRITEVKQDGTFITRGDANPTADSTPVSRESVTGVARLRVPLIGLPVVWLREGHFLQLGLMTVAVLATVQLLTGVKSSLADDDETPPGDTSAAGPDPDQDPGEGTADVTPAEDTPVPSEVSEPEHEPRPAPAPVAVGRSRSSTPAAGGSRHGAMMRPFRSRVRAMALSSWWALTGLLSNVAPAGTVLRAARIVSAYPDM